jgi:hypothetical protein
LVTPLLAWPPLIVQPAVSSEARAIRGFWNSRIAPRRAVFACSIGIRRSSASRRRRIARACSCDTRDSLTPMSAPISFIVASP